MNKTLSLCAIFFMAVPFLYGAESVSQYGITWYFDGDYQVGQFANGDYWVVGPVVIDSITPHFTGTGNGWEVNPMPTTSAHGFKVGCYRGAVFDSTLVPDLPYTARGNESIVKAVDNGTESRPCLKTAAVLTVLDSVPPDNGATVFRPPYAGTEKPLYSVNGLHTELLPTLAKPVIPNDLDAVAERYKMVQLDHFGAGLKQGMRPLDNLPNYGGDIGRDEGVAAVSLMLDDPLEDKMPALIAFVQCGIDYHHIILQDDFNWPSGGGEDPCHTLPWVFAAYMLDNDDMKSYIRAHNTDFMYNDTRIQLSRTGIAVFGETSKIGNPDTYWATVENHSIGDKTQCDPYGYVDGGPEPSGAYQDCCTSQPWKCQMIAFHLMPGMKDLWWNQALSDYVDRWVDFGAWAQPDPCAPLSQGGGHDAQTGFCVLDPDLEYFNGPDDYKCKDGEECGRFPERHGINTDGGGRGSLFINAMWAAYRDQTGPVHDPSMPSFIAAGKGTQVILGGNPVADGRNAVCLVLRQPGNVRMALYHADGKRAVVLTDRSYNAGRFYFNLQQDAGVYSLVVEAGGKTFRKNVVVTP